MKNFCIGNKLKLVYTELEMDKNVKKKKRINPKTEIKIKPK